MANIRHNLAYSALLTMSTYLVPLILFPYISRVLGIESIGRIDTIDNLMDYCILFSMMGLTSVGIREIAKSKDNPETLGQTFTDLFALNLCSTLLIAVVFGVTVWLHTNLSRIVTYSETPAGQGQIFFAETLYNPEDMGLPQKQVHHYR